MAGRIDLAADNLAARPARINFLEFFGNDDSNDFVCFTTITFTVCLSALLRQQAFITSYSTG
jgi:hypothetical protein